MRESFIIYRSFFALIKLLPEKKQVKMFTAIFEYGLDEKEPNFGSEETMKAIWSAIKPQLKANNKRYENGKKGGAPIGNANAEKQPRSEEKNNLDVPPKTTKTIQNKTTEKQPNVNDKVNDNYNIAAIAADKANKVLLNNAGAGARDCCVLNDPEKTAFLKSTFTNISGSLEIMYVAEAGAYGNTNQSSALAGILKHILETDPDDELQNATRSMTPKTFCAILQRMHDKPIANLEEYAKRVILGEYSMQDKKQCN